MTRAWTPAQQQAIAARQRTLVAAAAGSGKTSVLTELVVQALVAREAAPAEVCAVTFTEKAAQEMRGRIAERLAALGERDLLDELELARIGTIHSLCATVLRSHGAAIGIDPAAAVFDEAQLAWMLRAAVRDTVNELAGHRDVHWLRARMGDDRIEATLLGIHRCAAQGSGHVALLPPDDVAIPIHPKTGEPQVSAEEARHAQAAYVALWEAFERGVEERRLALGRVSFDDLERLAVEAVRVPEVATALRGRWSLILVDEFQDTNERQYELLHTIGGSRLFMVGDEWQSIYRFRGADVAVFRQRRDELGASSVVQMRENFRSSAPVLDVVNHIFAAPDLFGERYEPVLAGTDAQRDAVPPAVELLVVPDNPVGGAWQEQTATSRQREALRVAERIAELVESGEAEPGDIALLYARGTGVDHYEEALQAWGLPVLRAASGGYYDQRDVRDALAVLGAVRNPADDLAMLGVLAGPVASLGWAQLHAIRSLAVAENLTLHAAAFGSDLPAAVRAAAHVAELRERATACSLVELVATVAVLPELELGAAAEHDGVVRVANLRRLVELAASAQEIGIDGVAGFLEFVAAQKRDARVGEASIADETLGAVRLLTIHASKGLEFPYVF
ncbi:MAG: family ATPase, partial [Thermoleophilia bacterium]|nr:family ATPase [Thermoleophilia bacterium]